MQFIPSENLTIDRKACARRHDWGLVTADKKTGATSRLGVFSGGDCVTGPDLVVTAMVGGRKAAWAIDEYLKNK